MSYKDIVVSGDIFSVLIGRKFVVIKNSSDESRTIPVSEICESLDNGKRSKKVFNDFVDLNMVKNFLEKELENSLSGWSFR